MLLTITPSDTSLLIFLTILGAVLGAIAYALYSKKDRDESLKRARNDGHAAGRAEERPVAYDAGKREGVREAWSARCNELFTQLRNHRILPKGKHEVVSVTAIEGKTYAFVKIKSSDRVPGTASDYPPVAVVHLDTTRKIPSGTFHIVMDDDGLDFE